MNASAANWIEGARPRTLPAAIAPVVAGTGLAAHHDGFVWWKALLALVVALSLQVGVNYANDYSDGVRGTDTHRVGPLRLVGSGLVPPARVKAAAFGAFGLAALAGLALAVTTAWWLLLVGAAAILAAWYYTGGSRPYGYLGLGELSVFVFFGLVAVVGTTYVQTEQITLAAVTLGAAVGALACAILVANNLRDLPTDQTANKRTLAVVLGDARTRATYVGLHVAAAAALIVTAALESWWTLLGLLFAVVAAPAILAVRRSAAGRDLIPVLRDTGLAELVLAVGAAVGLAFTG